MIDFIPLELYYKVYVNISLFFVLFTLIHAFTLSMEDSKNVLYINFTGYFFLIFSIIYIGLRPVSGRYFGDMSTYYRYYTSYLNGESVNVNKDVLFHYFMKLCSYIMSPSIFFTVCFSLYILPMYRVSKVFFEEYWFYSFLMFVVSFSFWTYGTNGIRNGIAASIFLLALSYQNNKIIMIAIFVLATQIHQTLLLPVLAYFLTLVYNKPKVFLIVWLCAIPLSIIMGGFWEIFFASLGFGDERLGGYLLSSQENTGPPIKARFRYDFLIYSSVAVFTGCYCIFKKGFNDLIYSSIFSTYLLCNAFWILVIRASFSNRFAYLSWFFMALVIIYPFLKKNLVEKQHILIGKILTAYFMFTYLMYYIYYAK